MATRQQQIATLTEAACQIPDGCAVHWIPSDGSGALTVGLGLSALARLRDALASPEVALRQLSGLPVTVDFLAGLLALEGSECVIPN